MNGESAAGQTARRRAGQDQIEAAIGVMFKARGMQFDTPFTWRHDSERDVFVLEGHIGGQYCHCVLVGGAVENYVNDLNCGTR